MADEATIGFSGFARTSSTFGTWPTLTGNFSTDGLAHTTTTIVPVIGFKAFTGPEPMMSSDGFHPEPSTGGAALEQAWIEVLNRAP